MKRKEDGLFETEFKVSFGSNTTLYFSSQAHRAYYKDWVERHHHTEESLPPPLVQSAKIGSWTFADISLQKRFRIPRLDSNVIWTLLPMPDSLLEPSQIGYFGSTLEAINISEELIQGKNIIDLGCGEGLLSFAALKLGAHFVKGYDNDPYCIHKALILNGINKSRGAAQFVQKDLHELSAEDIEGTDVIMANIGPHPVYEGYEGTHGELIRLLTSTDSWHLAIVGGYGAWRSAVSPSHDMMLFSELGYQVEQHIRPVHYIGKEGGRNYFYPAVSLVLQK